MKSIKNYTGILNKLRRNNIKEKVKGKVKWFSQKKGYGFIVGEDDQDYFAHHAEILDNTNAGEGFLSEGDEVLFNVENTPKGLKATSITKQK